MKVFIDEDMGASIARALREVDVDVWWPQKNNLIAKGTHDDVWIPIVASDKRMILSRNIDMLEPENERQLLIDNEAALVIFPQHVRLLPLLRLVLRKWEWLESVYDNEPRPFAYSMTGTGIITKENLVHYTPRRHRPTWPPKQPGARRTRRLGPGQPPLLT